MPYLCGLWRFANAYLVKNSEEESMKKYLTKKMLGAVVAVTIVCGSTVGVLAANSDSFNKYINEKHGYMVGAIAIESSGSSKGVAAGTTVTKTGDNVYVTLEVQKNSTGQTVFPKQTKSGSKNANISTGMIYKYKIGAFSAHEIRSKDGSWGAYLRMAEK